jgi:hypothetical protein
VDRRRVVLILAVARTEIFADLGSVLKILAKIFRLPQTMKNPTMSHQRPARN